MADNPGANAPPQDLKAENKRLAVQFKAQHALMVGFFTLIAYVSLNVSTHPLPKLTSDPAFSTRSESTSSALASSSPDSSSSTAPNAPPLQSKFKMASYLVV